MLIGNWACHRGQGGLRKRRPHHDVARINAALADTAYGLFRADNAKLRENLTAQEMSDASAAAARATQPDDLLLIFYSGQGNAEAPVESLAFSASMFS